MVRRWRLIGHFPILYYPQLEVPLRGHLTSSQYADSWFFFIGQVAAYKTGALGPQIERHFPCEARQAPPPGKDDMKMLRYQVRVRERERERESGAGVAAQLVASQNTAVPGLGTPSSVC